MMSIRFILKLASDSPLAIHSNYERGFKLHWLDCILSIRSVHHIQIL